MKNVNNNIKDIRILQKTFDVISTKLYTVGTDRPDHPAMFRIEYYDKYVLSARQALKKLIDNEPLTDIFEKDDKKYSKGLSDALWLITNSQYEDSIYPYNDNLNDINKKMMMQNLLNLGADPNIVLNDLGTYYRQDTTPLLNLLTNATPLDVLEVLLQHGAKTQIDEVESPFCYAMRNYSSYDLKENVCKLLIKYGADISKPIDEKGNTPLCLFGIYDLKDTDELVKLFINEKILNLQNIEGNTPLHIASGLDYVNMCKILKEAGADTKIKNKKGKTPYEYALYNQCYNTAIELGGDERTLRLAEQKHKEDLKWYRDFLANDWMH